MIIKIFDTGESTTTKNRKEIQDQIAANPGVFGKMQTAGDLKAWAQQKMNIQAPVSAAGGAVISGPTDGYRPNLTAHGTEAIIPIKNHGKFTEEDRQTVEFFLRKEAFPQFYTNQVFKSLEFNDFYKVLSKKVLKKAI